MDFVQRMAQLSRQSTCITLRQTEHMMGLIGEGTAVAAQSHARSEEAATQRRAYFEAGQAFWLREAQRTV